MAGFRDADGLTAKQAKFAEKLADGESQAEAYRIAYDASGMAPETIHSHASRLAAKDTVRARVNAIAEERMRLIEARGISDRAKVIKLLRSFAEDTARPDHVRLRAVELWGKTCGAFVEVIEDRRERPAAAVAVELERRLGALLSAAAPQVTVIDMLPQRVNDDDGDDMGSTASDATASDDAAMDDEPQGGV